jgi:hypothetical protein
MPVEDFIIIVYCCVAESYAELVTSPLRSRGFETKLSDAEVITMEIVGEFIGKDQDKSLWRYFRNHWHDWFPCLGSRANFVKQSANLWQIKEQMMKRLARQMGSYDDRIHIIDGFPMPVCQITRAAKSRCFRGDAGYSYCAAKDDKYYGFEGHIIIDSRGVICGCTFADASIDERDVVQDMTAEIKGLLLGDKGYIRPLLSEELKWQDIDLQTPLRKNMKDSRDKTFVKQLMSARRLVETVIGQLSERFHIEKVRARDLWHAQNRFIRKLLAHTIGVFLNYCLGQQLLQFEVLVQL